MNQEFESIGTDEALKRKVTKAPIKLFVEFLYMEDFIAGSSLFLSLEPKGKHPLQVSRANPKLIQVPPQSCIGFYFRKYSLIPQPGDDDLPPHLIPSGEPSRTYYYARTTLPYVETVEQRLEHLKDAVIYSPVDYCLYFLPDAKESLAKKLKERGVSGYVWTMWDICLPLKKGDVILPAHNRGSLVDRL
jgi:hypothetical protein